MNDDDFCFAEQIRTEHKYFDVTLFEVLQFLLTEGCFQCSGEHFIDGGRFFVLQLNLYTKRAEMPTSWSASLKLRRQRIDCIDYEPRFKTNGGRVANGWHRHEWDPNARSAERRKRPLESFGSGKLGVREFLIRAASELRITFNKG